jgi:hypothetical protein
MIYDNLTNAWSPGSLGGAWPVPNVRLVALGGCHDPPWIRDNPPEGFVPGMSILYGSTNNAMQQLCWNRGESWHLCWVRADFTTAAGATCTWSYNLSISNAWWQNVVGNGLQHVWYEHDHENSDNIPAFEVWNGNYATTLYSYAFLLTSVIEGSHIMI